MPDSSPLRRGPHHLINPENPSILSTTPSPWKLGPLDLLTLYFIPVAVVFVYEANSSSPSPPITLDRLQTALGYLLNYYPHLTGRFRIDLTAGKHHIDRLGTGAALHEAMLDQPLSLYRKAGVYSILDQPGAGNDLLAPYEFDVESLSQSPIFTVQYTRFACGGVAVGIRCPHIVTDGDGFFRLAADLATIYRGLGGADRGKLPVGREPCVKPYTVDFGGDEAEMEMARAYKPRLFSVVEPVETPAPSVDTPPAPRPPVTGREFHFSSSDLRKIQLAASDPTLPKPMSSFIAFSAWLYQQVHKARLTLQSQHPETHKIISTDFLTPLDLRVNKRLPHLPPNYFPNAVMAHYTNTITPDILSASPLPIIAKHILHMITASATIGAEAENTVKWLAAQPNLNHVQFGMKHGPGAFMISQWSRYDMYGEGSVQFVEGERPVLVSPPFTPISLVDALAYVLPPHLREGKEGDGVVVYLSLIEPLWAILEREGLLYVKGV